MCSDCCVNTVGSFSCCEKGYKVDADGKCTADIDECSEGFHTCDSDQNCINNDGSYECDFNECAGGSHICPAEKICVNTIGSYQCDCVDSQPCAKGKNYCSDNTYKRPISSGF